MSTVDKSIANRIIAGEFPENGAVKIIEYDNAWGGVGYGVVFKNDNPDKYRETEFVRNPRVYWEAKEIEIKCRFSGSVLFSHDTEKNNLCITVEAAVTAGANLSGAYLSGAYLSGANLSGAYLSGANLSGAYLDGERLTKAPLSLLNLRWAVLVTGRYLRIGCQRHLHADWLAFSDTEIANMANGALDFWRTWKAPLMAMCVAHSKE